MVEEAKKLSRDIDKISEDLVRVLTKHMTEDEAIPVVLEIGRLLDAAKRASFLATKAAAVQRCKSLGFLAAANDLKGLDQPGRG